MRYAVAIEKAEGNYEAYVLDLSGFIATWRSYSTHFQVRLVTGRSYTQVSPSSHMILFPNQAHYTLAQSHGGIVVFSGLCKIDSYNKLKITTYRPTSRRRKLRLRKNCILQ